MVSYTMSVSGQYLRSDPILTIAAPDELFHVRVRSSETYIIGDELIWSVPMYCEYTGQLC